MAGTWLLTISALAATLLSWGHRSALIAPFYVWWFKPQYTFPVSMLSCLILLRHHDNIYSVCGVVRKPASGLVSKEEKAPEQK